MGGNRTMTILTMSLICINPRNGGAIVNPIQIGFIFGSINPRNGGAIGLTAAAFVGAHYQSPRWGAIGYENRCIWDYCLSIPAMGGNNTAL